MTGMRVIRQLRFEHLGPVRVELHNKGCAFQACRLLEGLLHNAGHLFREVLEEEEEHIDYLETQFSLMEMLGDQLYIARHVSPEAGEG